MTEYLEAGGIVGKALFSILLVVFGWYIIRDLSMSRKAKKEGITYKEMKLKINKSKDGGKIV